MVLTKSKEKDAKAWFKPEPGEALDHSSKAPKHIASERDPWKDLLPPQASLRTASYFLTVSSSLTRCPTSVQGT